MTSKIFSEKLEKMLESRGRFTVNNLDKKDMEELRIDALLQGFNDILVVAGDNEDEIFALLIKKCK